jgi:glycosyltransferase involved in cell wall biosynthesis
MRILIVVPDQDRISGNWVSARRFQHGLETHGHQVTVHGVQLHADAVFQTLLHEFLPDVAILLHAYRSGKPWLDIKKDLNIPYVVALTGTDINHGLDDPKQGPVIRSVLQQSAFSLLQNPLIAAEFSTTHPNLSENLCVLPPGITLGEATYDLRNNHGLAKEKTLFLCPAGLRPVKGVLELMEMFDQVTANNSASQLAFCGPILEESYGKRFLAAVEERPWASYLGAIPPDAMACAMRDADVILNNSRTEGLANVLLEAATIGVPILASKIPGNAAVVRHNSNGLLYSNAAEFTNYARQLLDRDRRLQLTCPDPDRYDTRHETTELIRVLQKTIRS